MGWLKIQSAMRPMRVVVMHEGRNRAFEILLVQNQQPVEALESSPFVVEIR